ncbi:ankyrin repeat domain-containing protein 26 isoform X3 [Patagioenas fasciata]|uniref:ankyrin repeat domain-containing protein 26 isoform X3 n=1 Tax=Patagioenas fasciata TaxID=372321 RepID=UPI003A98E50E
MKKIFGFGWKKKGQSPSGGASLPCPAGAYDIQHKELSKLHRAAASGDLAQVRRGLKKFSIDGRDKAARTPLHLACANGHVDVVTYLVESKCKLNLPDSDNRSPLMKAVQCQQEKCVAILLEHGAEPNLPDADGNTALHLSVISPNTTVAELLLDYYANIEARNKEGFTPLALAISEHQEEIVEFLLGHGADVHARDQRERTPLMIAASDGELNLVKVLLRYGADVSHTDPHEWTAEDYAVIHGYSSLSELLAQHADSENTGEASAGAAAGLPVLSIPPWVGTAGIKLGAPAVDRAIDDSSQGDSVRSSEKEEGDDTWHTSEEEELDFTPKKPQKPNLTLLMNASQKFRKKNDGDGSRIESPKLPEKSLREEQEEEDQENEETQSKDIQGESPEWEEKEEEQEKEDTGEKLRTAVLEGVKNSVSNGNHQVHNASKEDAGDLPAEGAEEEEDNDSPWDSEIVESDCEGMRQVSSGVFVPTTDRHGIYSKIVSEECNNGFSEKPSNSRLKTPESALEMKETSPKKRQQDPGDLPAEGAEEDNDSPWDSEIVESDCEGMRQVSSGVFVPATDRHGIYSKIVSEECNNGFSEKPSNSQLKTPESALEMKETSPKKRQQDPGDLPAEGAEEDNDSPWDSEIVESDCEGMRQVSSGVFLPATDRHGIYSKIVSEECNNGFSEKPSNSQLKTPESALEMKETSPKKRQQDPGDLPAEGAEEDNDSPWDSEIVESDCEGMRQVSSGVFVPATDRHGIYSKIVSEGCNNGFSEKPSNSRLKTPESALEMKETSPKKRQQDPGECSGSTCRMSSSAEKEDIKDAFENDEMQDKYILETINLIQKTARENQTDKAEIPPQEALVENEEMHSAGKQLSPKPWEERYERMWVESEKRELKTNFKSITAELKQLFGEINETRKTTSLVGEMSEEGFSEEVKSSCVVSSLATESDKRLENKGEFGDLKLKRGGKVPKTEIVIPSLGVLPDQNNLNANLEGSWSTDEDDSTNHADNIKVPLAKGEEEKMPVMEMEENENGSSRNVMGRPEYSPRRNLNTSILDDVSNILPKIQSVSTSDENALFVRERKLGKDSGFNGDVPRECLIDNNKRETEIESLLANAQPLCGTLKKNLDEELKQDMERFKSKVGVLQIVFLALEKEKVQLQKEVEKEKSRQRCFKTEVMANQEDLDKLNTPPGNITDEQMKQKVTLRKKDSSKIETGNTAEVKDEKNFSSEKRLKCIKMPMKGKPSLNAKVSKKNKRQASKKKADKQMSSCAGNNFQVLDDSTSSETSQDERRPAAKLGSEKNKVSTQMDVTADRDLARSSDTTSADAELPTSTCKEAMLLLEQLHVDHTSSAILLKLQNILLEYEQIIEHEKNRYLAVWREVRKLESEKESSQLRAEETQEWKNDIQSLKCTLKQEEEKRLRVETLYEKTSETLGKKEDQYCKEMEEKQQLELRSRNLEMELITLRKLLKQVEEERDDTQRQLSQEKSARALQEEILNHHLWRQKELEEEARRSIEKNADESDTEREKDLLYKNQLLQDEITRLRVELDQVRFRHQEEEGKYLEENETLKVKTEDLKKELKLNEEALAQTVFQYNGQLSLLKTESAVLNSKLEQTKESKDRLETEIESFRSRLNTTLQELERHQSSKSDVERTFQRERDEWLHLQDRLHRDLSDVRETNQSLSQQLSKAESKANSLENELHQLKQTLREKTLLLEMTQKELSQAQSQAKECDHARQLEKDQVNKFIIKQESMQERLAHFQSENLLLRQQLEDMQNKGILKEKVVNDMQDRFNDIFNKLRADTEKQVYLVEERNKELNAKCTDLREQVFKYETDKVEREGMIRQLQQELADALKKQSMSEASLEVTARYRSHLEEDKLRLQKELEKVKTKIHNRLEELMSSLQTTQAAAEDHHHQQIGELSQQLEAQSRKCKDLEAENQDLQEELSTMREKHQKLETRKCQLIEEVANLKHHLKTSMVDHNHMEQYKKEVEQRAEQEIRQKLQEVNLFLQTQAACQDRLEQIRASHHASLRKQLKYRIRDLECELDRIKNIQQDNIFQKESTQAEVERYKGLYLEEVKIRRCLANKLERANEKLAEANAHLLQERHRNKSLIASSIVSGGVAPSPVLYSNELGHLGNNLALNRSLSLGGSFLSPAESTLSSRNRVEAYVAKVRQELDEKITKDLEQATAELKTGSTGASPVGSTDGSSKNAHVDQDPLCRAIQEYRDVLTKNYRIC